MVCYFESNVNPYFGIKINSLLDALYVIVRVLRERKNCLKLCSNYGTYMETKWRFI